MPVTIEQFRADLVSRRDEAWTAHTKTNDRWVLSLAIGNGGAFLALGGRVLEKANEAGTALAMPSLWLFAAGLFAAGINPFIEAQRALWQSRSWERSIERLDADLQDEGDDPQAARLDRHLYVFQTGLELFSAAAFAAGLVYPLIVLSHRYLTSGVGFF
jgi:hypothetical protein